jgi:SAM-dependent methyltransferase
VSKKEPRNYWRDDRCAKAFWSQSDIPAYQELMADTTAWLDPKAGERWLDLGCGAGRLSMAVWTLSGGTVESVIGLDVADLNSKAYEKINRDTQPPPNGKIRFQQADLGKGIPFEGTAIVDGVVSGLAIQYAEHFDETADKWTDRGYDQILREVYRVLKPGGRFIFSVNVPEPSWGRVARESMRGLKAARKKGWYMLKLWRMYRYGGWLKREARKGRFHYLKDDVIATKLHAAGFVDIECKTSFAGQAFLFRCQKK